MKRNEKLHTMNGIGPIGFWLNILLNNVAIITDLSGHIPSLWNYHEPQHCDNLSKKKKRKKE